MEPALLRQGPRCRAAELAPPGSRGPHGRDQPTAVARRTTSRLSPCSTFDRNCPRTALHRRAPAPLPACELVTPRRFPRKSGRILSATCQQTCLATPCRGTSLYSSAPVSWDEVVQ